MSKMTYKTLELEGEIQAEKGDQINVTTIESMFLISVCFCFSK